MMRIVVVGGGLFGASTAYELARAGEGRVEVVLIERDAPDAHASAKNPGNLNPLLATPPGLETFALACFHRHASLLNELLELGCQPYGMEQVRRILLAFDADELASLQPIQALFSQTPGFSAEYLSPDVVRHTDARLTQDVYGAVLVEGNRSVHSGNFLLALLEGAERLGVRRVRAEATGLLAIGTHRINMVQTTAGDFACDAVVLACGPWVAESQRWLGMTLPVRPIKGEMMRLKLSGENIRYDFTHGLISLYRRGEDELWLGVTREDCGFDEAPSDAGRERLLAGAERIMPKIREATVIEHLASLRPMGPGGLPVLDVAHGYDNVILATGGGIKGVLTCVGIGQAVAEVLIRGKTTWPVDGFSVARDGRALALPCHGG